MDSCSRICFLYMAFGDELTLQEVGPRLEKNLTMLLPNGSTYFGSTWARPKSCLAGVIIRFPKEEDWQDWVLSAFGRQVKPQTTRKQRRDQAEELWLTKSTALFEPITRTDLSTAPDWILANSKNSFDDVNGWARPFTRYSAPVQVPQNPSDSEDFLRDKQERIVSLGCNKHCGGGVFGDFDSLLQTSSKELSPQRRSARALEQIQIPCLPLLRSITIYCHIYPILNNLHDPKRKPDLKHTSAPYPAKTTMAITRFISPRDARNVNTSSRPQISTVAAKGGGVNQRLQSNLFQDLEVAVSQHEKSTEAVLQILRKLKSKWSMDEPDFTSNPFEDWILRNVNEEVWQSAITIMYKAKIDESDIKLKQKVEQIATSLKIEPNRLFFHIGESVLCSTRGISSLKSLVTLSNNNFDLVLKSIHGARQERLTSKEGKASKKSVREDIITVSDITDAMTEKKERKEETEKLKAQKEKAQVEAQAQVDAETQREREAAEAQAQADAGEREEEAQREREAAEARAQADAGEREEEAQREAAEAQAQADAGEREEEAQREGKAAEAQGQTDAEEREEGQEAEPEERAGAQKDADSQKDTVSQKDQEGADMQKDTQSQKNGAQQKQTESLRDRELQTVTGTLQETDVQKDIHTQKNGTQQTQTETLREAPKMVKRKYNERQSKCGAQSKRLRPCVKVGTTQWSPQKRLPITGALREKRRRKGRYEEKRKLYRQQKRQLSAYPQGIPTQIQFEGLQGLCSAQKQQDDLFNDERRHALLRAYHQVCKEDPNTHLANAGQLAIYIFQYGRPAKVWTAGSEGSQNVGFSADTISIHGKCNCKYDEADILLLTEREHAMWAANNNDPKIIIIRDHKFLDRRPHQTFQRWFDEMEIEAQVSITPMKIDVQVLNEDTSTPAVQNMTIQDAFTLWRDAEASPEICIQHPPVNFLNIADSGYGCWPGGITKHYGYLRKIVSFCESFNHSREESNVGKPTSLQLSPVDIQKCMGFSIVAQRGAASGWHEDQNGVTTVLTLEGNDDNSKAEDVVKYWPVFPINRFRPEEQDAFREDFKEHGEKWRPKLQGAQIPVIALVCGDTLIQPPGTIHAPITLTNCMFTGAMVWRERDLKQSLTEWLFLAENANCTNEPLPQQTPEILQYLLPRVKLEPRKFGYTAEELPLFEDTCHRLLFLTTEGRGCGCSTACGKRCGCSKKGIPCGVECHKGLGRDWTCCLPLPAVYDRKFFPKDLPAKDLTHVLYAFANIRPDGEVFLSDEEADTKKHFEADSITNDDGANLYGCLQQLYMLKKKNRYLKVLLSIGGWSYRDNFAVPAATLAGRSRFASSVVSLVRNLGLDGVDIDWEYPTDNSQAENFVYLLREVRTALDAYSNSLSEPYPFLLTVAAPAGPQQYQTLHLAKMDQYVDFWNLMAYDYSSPKTATHRANLFHDSINPKSTPFNTNATVDYYVSQGGIRPKKIVLGIPIYGHAFNHTDGLGHPSIDAVSGTWEAGTYDFKVLPMAGSEGHIVDKLGASYSYDNTTRELISYDNMYIVLQKANWLKEMDLGGAMWWESSADAIGDNSLIRAATVTLKIRSNLDNTLNQLDYPDSIYANIRARMSDSETNWTTSSKPVKSNACSTTSVSTTSDATTFDATPSDATPSDATTSDATTSDATTSDATTSDATLPMLTTSDATSDATTSATTTTSSTAANHRLTIQKWTGLGCTGSMLENDYIPSEQELNTLNRSPNPYLSFSISRPLRGREQLDLSTEPGVSSCRKFLHSYWPRDSPGSKQSYLKVASQLKRPHYYGSQEQFKDDEEAELPLKQQRYSSYNGTITLSQLPVEILLQIMSEIQDRRTLVRLCLVSTVFQGVFNMRKWEFLRSAFTKEVTQTQYHIHNITIIISKHIKKHLKGVSMLFEVTWEGLINEGRLDGAVYFVDSLCHGLDRHDYNMLLQLLRTMYDHVVLETSWDVWAGAFTATNFLINYHSWEAYELRLGAPFQSEQSTYNIREMYDWIEHQSVSRWREIVGQDTLNVNWGNVYFVLTSLQTYGKDEEDELIQAIITLFKKRTIAKRDGSPNKVL
ncbi:hypothetical protein V496_00977 [Pseudogymnoascus sp. VKM F-4515 (FW-2607)]|nr:hypothetical protein V496_00977 [Pseudogymnoascus sp. VKM F-4515 (FW-2607)]